MQIKTYHVTNDHANKTFYDEIEKKKGLATKV
jgi:hypothetical protein